MVAQHLGSPVSANSRADVNGDGTVNILDLVVVAQHLGESTGGAAPSGLVEAGVLDPAMVRAWVAQAHAENDGSLAFQQGIANLQHLLALMVPKKTALFANYPNPFNPETWIPYQLSKPTDVALTIYDINGRVMRALDLGHQPAGIYQSKNRAAYWDGKNEVGEPVASGDLFLYAHSSGFLCHAKDVDNEVTVAFNLYCK